MADRFKFAEVRQEIIEMLKVDLLGPSSENEILNQNPRFEYIVGMLAPQTSENDSNEQEIDGDASFDGDADYTVGEDDDNEPVSTNRFKTPSSIGISFYLESSTKSFNVDVTWGDYTKASAKAANKEGKEVNVSAYTRHPQKETVVVDLQEFNKSKEYPLVCDSNVVLYISKIGLKQGYTLVTAYVINKRKNPESDVSGMMFQVHLRAYSQGESDIFVAEHICRKILAVDEFYFAQRPILGRGRGCAATWKANKDGRAKEILSTFIPEYEFPGVSAALEGFDPFYFSMRTLSVAKKKDDIIARLNVLADSYEDWIQKKLIHDSKMDDAKFKKEIGDTVIKKCMEALGRIRAGIQLLVEDDIAFDAFCFMNRSMILRTVITIPNIAQKLLLFFSVSAYYCRFLSSYVLPSGFWRTFLAHNHTFRRFVAALSTIGEVRAFLLRSMPEYPLWFRCPPRPPGATRFFYSCRHRLNNSTCSDSGKSQKCSCVTAFRIAAVCFSENDRSRATSSSLTFFLSSLVIISPPPVCAPAMKLRRAAT